MTAERRTYYRHPIIWDTEVIGHGYGPLAFEIRNFCEGGVFIAPATRAADERLRKRQDTDPHIELRLRDPVNSQRYSVSARVVRSCDSGFGIAFHRPQPQLVSALLTVSESDRSAHRGTLTPSGSRGSAAARRPRTELAHCRSLLADYLAGRMDTFLSQAEGALFAAAEQTAGNAEQTAYLGGTRMLREQRRVLGRGLADAVLANWDRLGKYSIETEQAATDQSELSLVDETELNDWLIRSEAITRAESRAIRPLRNLQRRLSVLAGSPVDERSNPISPTALVQLLADRLDDFQPDMKVREVLYPVFGKTVLYQLSVLYDSLNAELRRQGILPELEQERPKITNVRSLGPRSNPMDEAQASSREGAEPAPREGTASHAPPGTPSAQPGIGGLYRTVRELFRASRNRVEERTEGTENANPVPAAEPAEVLQALESLDAAPTGSGHTLADALQQALQRRHPDRPVRLGGEQRETVELLDQWFSGLREAEGGDRGFFRDWSARLMPLALREELQRGQFLEGENLPLHQVIDALDQAAQSLAGMRDRERERARQDMEATLRGARGQGVAAPAGLGPAARHQEAQAGGGRRVQEAAMERVRQACDGSERLEQAREAVDEALDGILGGKQVPEPLLDLLDQAWRNRLVLLELRRDREPENWRRSLRAVELLLYGIGSPDVPRRPVNGADTLLHYIEQSLLKANVPPDRVNTLVEGVAYWLKLPAGSRELPVCRRYLRTQARPASAEPDDLPQEWLGQAKLLEPGDWVFFHGDTGRPEPLRLAWTSRQRDRFVFVNRAGQKSAELSLAELARRLGARQADTGQDLNAPATQRRWQEMLVRMNRELSHRATHDPLTGLLNRRALERRVEHLLQHPAGARYRHSVLQIALDDFKVVNHKLGHSGGDKVLRMLGSLLREQAGKRGLVSRLGGDEFAILLVRNTDDDAGEQLARELLTALQHQRFTVDEQPIRLTASIGVVSFSRETHRLAELLRDVDNACFAAKESGGNRVHVYRPGDAELEELRHSMEQASRVDQALEGGLLSLRCQRIQPLQHGDWPPMYEMLIVIANDAQGSMRPDQVIPAAERFGRMPALDRWVVSQTLRWMKEHPDRLDTLDALSINLSGQTLNDVGFMDFLRQEFRNYRVSPQRVCFEVTETAAVANLSLAADMIREFKHMGCRFALDDFGSGLSSYAYLKNLPADYLKIDGEFIRELDRPDADDAMVKSIHELAHHLGKLTVAEFVETDRVRERLAAIGVDYVQGFSVHRPVPLEALGVVN
ncbi:MAG: DUF1631 family protein [Ectothiorhodospiraceae bacterium]|nr:DUF1631 family protein [Ectothiorhodospiraceae bacterium]